MIESTNLKMLRNLEAFQVFSDILAFLQEEESVEEPLQGLCDAFAARLSDYDTALVSERRSRYTAELARLDGQRDYVFRSFTAQLKLYLSSFDSGQQPRRCWLWSTSMGVISRRCLTVRKPERSGI